MNMNRRQAREGMVARPGLVRPVDSHGNSGTFARLASAEKPAFKDATSPSSERVPSGKISTISPALRAPQRFFQSRKAPVRPDRSESHRAIGSANGMAHERIASRAPCSSSDDRAWRRPAPGRTCSDDSRGTQRAAGGGLVVAPGATQVKQSGKRHPAGDVQVAIPQGRLPAIDRPCAR